jgi:hypothetical protein
MISHADMTGLLKSRGNVNFTEATTPSFLRVCHQSTTDQTKQPKAAPPLRRSPRSWRHETPEFGRHIRHTRPKRPTMSGAFLLHEGLQCWNPQIIKESHGPGLRPSTTPFLFPMEPSRSYPSGHRSRMTRVTGPVENRRRTAHPENPARPGITELAYGYGAAGCCQSRPRESRRGSLSLSLEDPATIGSRSPGPLLSAGLGRRACMASVTAALLAFCLSWGCGAAPRSILPHGNVKGLRYPVRRLY